MGDEDSEEEDARLLLLWAQNFEVAQASCAAAAEPGLPEPAPHQPAAALPAPDAQQTSRTACDIAVEADLLFWVQELERGESLRAATPDAAPAATPEAAATSDQKKGTGVHGQVLVGWFCKKSKRAYLVHGY